MRIQYFAAAAALLSTTAALATSGPTRSERAVAQLLGNKVAGTPVDSIDRFSSQSMSVYDGFVLFRVSRDLVYRNDMNGCPQLREDDVLITRLYGSARLARGDIAEIASRTGGAFFTKGACPFGAFVPYRTAPTN